MSDGQDKLDLGSEQQDGRVEEYKFEPIKGYPMLNWRGKRPFTSTQFYPAQLKEVHGPEVDGWRNKIFWGDNLQVMSHLLKDFRGQVDLVYIDPPFDSRADYRRNIKVRSGKSETSSYSSFEEKQYSDIWTNDLYLQYMFERIIILRELMKSTGSIYIHCDWHKSHHLRLVCDEVFGSNNFRNEIIWQRGNPRVNASGHFSHNTDTILFYTKSSNYTFEQQFTPLSEDYLDKYYSQICEVTGKRFMPSPLIGHVGTNKEYEWRGFVRAWRYPKHRLDELDADGRIYWPKTGEGVPRFKKLLEETRGRAVQSLWTDISSVNSQAAEDTGYPTQKPEALLERIINASCPNNGLIFDAFMGSGTTQAAAAKTGRRFIGCDINLGAIQTTISRLNSDRNTLFSGTPGLEVYNVNHYDLFRNPVEAKALLLEALECQDIEAHSIFDGEKDGRMVKIMPINRIATRADLSELIAGFDQKLFQRRYDEKPNQPVEKILLVCMGHEPDLKAELELQAKPFKIDVEVVDILRDKSQLEFKRDSEAKLAIRSGELVIENFYPMNLLQKLSLQQEQVGEWRELVDSVMVDWNYDGAVLQPAVVDVPGKDEFVAGRYQVPADAGTIRVKITDLLSESWEGEIDG